MLMQVDREAFESCGQTNTRFIMKQFWQSVNNKIIVAKKRDTGAVLGYAIFSVGDPVDTRFGPKKRIPAVYLLRIGVRLNCQRQGIGRRLMNYMLTTYPSHALSLDVSTDNETAVRFYQRVGLQIRDIYTSVPDEVEFALFETPLDRRGRKIMSVYEAKLRGEMLDHTGQMPVQKYHASLDEYSTFLAMVDEKAEEPVSGPAKSADTAQTDSRFNTPKKPTEAHDALDCLSSKTADNTEERLYEDGEESESPKAALDEKDQLEVCVPEITLE